MGQKEIEIVPGDGNLNISPAEDHINEIVGNSKKAKKGEIVIPKTKNDNK